LARGEPSVKPCEGLVCESPKSRVQPRDPTHYHKPPKPLGEINLLTDLGFYQTLDFINESRIGIASQALGIAQGAFDRAVAYAKQRVQFGQPISSFQVIQHKLADMATKIETARLVVYKAAWLVDQGRGDIKMSSMAKLHAARTAVEVCDEAVQILGGYGYLLENEVERFYRDARITEIYEGTREIQKNTIAARLI